MEKISGYIPVSFTSVHIDVTRGYAQAFVSENDVRRLSEGHFPGRPFVPGAYLMGWIVTLARDLLRACGRHPGTCRIERCEFLLPVEVGPATAVEAEFRAQHDEPIHGRVTTGSRLASRARLRFGTRP